MSSMRVTSWWISLRSSGVMNVLCSSTSDCRAILSAFFSIVSIVYARRCKSSMCSINAASSRLPCTSSSACWSNRSKNLPSCGMKRPNMLWVPGGDARSVAPDRHDTRAARPSGAADARWTVSALHCAVVSHRGALVARRVESGTSSPLHVSAENQLRVALDNMPGALVYTDAAHAIVFCNDRFREMYVVPPALLTPGRPYADLLRYLAQNGYYGPGDVDALVDKRLESLRNPSGRSFEDHAPDGRWYRIV